MEGTVVVALAAITVAAVAGSSAWWWLGVPLNWLPVLGYSGYLLLARPSTHTFCMVQVRELAEQYRELDRRGVGVALISAQRAGITA